MEYGIQIQNGLGEVYTSFLAPATAPVSAEELRDRLNAELADILGESGATISTAKAGGVDIPVVLMNVDVLLGNEQERLDRLYATLGRLTHPPEQAN